MNLDHSGMSQMRNAVFAAIAAVGFATVARGATLIVVPDKAVYVVGETVTLKVSGDAQGEKTSVGVQGFLVYSGSGSVPPRTQAQRLVGVNWSAAGIGNGGCPSDPYAPPQDGCATGGFGFSEAFHQLVNYDDQTSDALFIAAPPQTADLLPSDNPFSTVTLTATAPGVVNVRWSSKELWWFSTTPTTAIGTSFVIVPSP